MESILDIVNENDQVVGQATRDEIHQKGLLHREVAIFFITPTKEIIFQHRAKNKNASPDLLGATVAGHVERGDSYELTAIKEAEEETGIIIRPRELIVVGKFEQHYQDKVTKSVNKIFSQRYVYIYHGQLKDLKVEVGEAESFEAWPLDKLGHLTNQEEARFVTQALLFVVNEIADFIKSLPNLV